MKDLVHIFTPNHVISKQSFLILVIGQVLIGLTLWSFSSFPFLPTPREILSAWWLMFTGPEKLVYHFISSFKVITEAIFITTLLSAFFVYLGTMPGVRPIVALISKFRFMGLVGFTLLFTLMTSSGHELKVALLVFGMSVWFVTMFAAEIDSIPAEKYDHARTLGMSRLREVWEVVVLGKAEAAFETLRQNAAIGWLMLTMVEGISRSEGGLGTLLLTQNRHMHFDKIFAVLLTIFVYGILQDYAIGWLKQMILPYTKYGKERK